MKLEKASRKKAKIKVSISGTSGSGKSYGSILLSLGICKDSSKICIIDTESYSASLYNHLGEFNVINLTAPFHPDRYIEAIKLCEQSGIEVIIIDNATNAWSGQGGCLQLHEKETSRMKVPNSFTAWNSITPIYQKYLDAIINSSCHIICTLRSKTEYVMSERNGRQVPQKVGTAPMIKDGFDYEMFIAFDLDQQHKVFCTKDRTGLFQDKEPFVITTDTGKQIYDWCNNGADVTVDDVSNRINDCISIKDLLALYQEFPHYKEALKPEFERRKRQIMIHQEVQPQLNHQQNLSSNGVH
jgi:hypothetical protein